MKKLTILGIAVIIAILSACGSAKSQEPRCSKSNKSNWNHNFINTL